LHAKHKPSSRSVKQFTDKVGWNRFSLAQMARTGQAHLKKKKKKKKKKKRGGFVKLLVGLTRLG